MVIHAAEYKNHSIEVRWQNVAALLLAEGSAMLAAVRIYVNGAPVSPVLLSDPAEGAELYFKAGRIYVDRL
ncbi:hypothetical protein DKM44_02460 [Deinococcus irradiatisoli]|uniref:Uncharacterized protein n=1 Tax=Deinococcus irradiatisoli TaxID=2202254 RepID=A0A2Z3JJY3_9DEIO|nr:hypothetical protein [Deinococcus irradiatisoli]AWN22238.1 hypothetical protein DKM44_02460 [Deinococcus irradiatisoli]